MGTDLEPGPAVRTAGSPTFRRVDEIQTCSCRNRHKQKLDDRPERTCPAVAKHDRLERLPRENVCFSVVPGSRRMLGIIYSTSSLPFFLSVNIMANRRQSARLP